MLQAAKANSITPLPLPTGFNRKSSRRTMLGILLGSIALAASGPALTLATPAWDAADWMARFVDVGGYVTRDGVGWILIGAEQSKKAAATAMMDELDADPARWKAVQALHASWTGAA